MTQIYFMVSARDGEREREGQTQRDKSQQKEQIIFLVLVSNRHGYKEPALLGSVSTPYLGLLLLHRTR